MCLKIDFSLPVWSNHSLLKLSGYMNTCDHGDITEFIKCVEAKNSVKIDASVPYSDLIEIVQSFFNSQNDVTELGLSDLFVHLLPVLDFVC